MSRGEKAAYNMITSAMSQIVSMVSAFILPRLIMTSFGSAYNGITASVTQFISIVAILRSGIGGATRVALYKALANNDNVQVSATIKATEKFMRKIALIFVGFIVVFSCAYPLLVKDEFDWLFSATLVLIISISTFVQYYYGITYQFLLQADQREYVTTLIDMGAVVLNVFLSVVLIKSGVGIHGVKLGSSFAFSIVPIILHIYCKKHYHIINDVNPDFSAISQRWDAFYHQLAAFVHNNTDITLLTIFSSQKIISVYTTYYLVGNGIKRIVLTFASGIEAAFGDIIARKETQTLQNNLKLYETMIHIISCILFGAALVLVTPFVKVYTLGVTDVNYTRYAFGYLVIISEMLYCLRSPYESIVNAAGHFKQTKKFAFIEAGLNLLISITLVWKYDLIGVVIGTTVAITFRIITFGAYAEREIINRPVFEGIKRFFVSGITIILIFCISRLVPIGDMASYSKWVIYAIPVTILSFMVTTVINLGFYKEETMATLKRIIGIGKRILRKNAKKRE